MRVEARALMPLLQNGSTVESLRNLITVTPAQKLELLALAKEGSHVRARLLAMFEFRSEVEREFDALMARNAAEAAASLKYEDWRASSRERKRRATALGGEEVRRRSLGSHRHS